VGEKPFRKRMTREKGAFLPSFLRKPESSLMPSFKGIRIWTPFSNGVTRKEFSSENAHMMRRDCEANEIFGCPHTSITGHE
jgi:hypothetical protein